MRLNKITALLVGACFSAHAAALDLSGTIFETKGTEHSIDPLLIYSVALAESASGRGKGTVSPWFWALRSPNTSFYGRDLEEAKVKLKEFQQDFTSIDVGVMQVNLLWHGHRVESAEQLLDPTTNISVGSDILAQAIKSAPGDLELGVGRYNNWANEDRARNYGSRVLAIYNNLQDL